MSCLNVLVDFCIFFQLENMTHFLSELGMMNYATLMYYCPSMLAASAVFAARCTLNKTPFWNETLKLHTGYSQEQLMYVKNKIRCCLILFGFFMIQLFPEFGWYCWLQTGIVLNYWRACTPVLEMKSSRLCTESILILWRELLLCSHQLDIFCLKVLPPNNRVKKEAQRKKLL